MISYYDRKFTAMFDDFGTLIEFRPIPFRGPPVDAIGGETGKKMIAELRAPRLRVVEEINGAKVGRPV